MTVQCSGGGVNGMNGMGRQGLAWSGMAVMGTVRCLPDIVAGTFRSRLSVARSCRNLHSARHIKMGFYGRLRKVFLRGRFENVLFNIIRRMKLKRSFLALKL